MRRLFLARWTNGTASNGWSRLRSPSKKCKKTRTARRMRTRCGAPSSPKLPELKQQGAELFAQSLHCRYKDFELLITILQNPFECDLLWHFGRKKKSFQGFGIPGAHHTHIRSCIEG